MKRTDVEKALRRMKIQVGRGTLQAWANQGLIPASTEGPPTRRLVNLGGSRSSRSRAPYWQLWLEPKEGDLGTEFFLART